MVTKNDVIEAIKELMTAEFEHGRYNTTETSKEADAAFIAVLNKLAKFEQELLKKEINHE